jgi:acetylornithine aminotransferase
MLGVVLSAPVAPRVVRAALDHGLLVNATGPAALRLVPPLVLTEAQADQAVERLGAAFTAVRAGEGLG